MDSDLIALVVALGLGATVVVVGLRRDLSETTRSNLPRFEGDSEPVVATGPSGDGRRKGLSPRQERWFAFFYLVFSLFYAADAALSSDERLLHLVFAAGFAFAALVLVRRVSRRPSGTSSD